MNFLCNYTWCSDVIVCDKIMINGTFTRRTQGLQVCKYNCNFNKKFLWWGCRDLANTYFKFLSNCFIMIDSTLCMISMKWKTVQILKIKMMHNNKNSFNFYLFNQINKFIFCNNFHKIYIGGNFYNILSSFKSYCLLQLKK